MTSNFPTQFQREQWLAKNLGVAFAERLGVNQFDAGVTTTQQRRERLRAVILERGLADVTCVRRRDRSVQTYARVFELTYGTPLLTDELAFAGDLAGGR